jgi:predicted nucleic acid-binding protein
MSEKKDLYIYRTLKQIFKKGIDIIERFQKMNIEIVPINLRRVTEISYEYKIYAYDAYVLEWAERLKSKLVTLDIKMREIAKKLCISVMEV